MINIQKILTTSLKDRSIFHSEADFQHHLAWCIHTELKNSELRLEYPLLKNDLNGWEYCDIFIKSTCNIGIELKYKTKLLTTNIGSERFKLKNQQAQDIGRYDFLKDVQRLENWCNNKRIDFGYAIILTNDHLYWSSTKRNTNDKDFRLHDRKITGKLRWEEKASAKILKKTGKSITLKNEYLLEWKDVNSNFKYLFLQVK